MNVAEIMTKNVASCRMGDSLNRAAQVMWEGRIGCLPVLDEGECVVGMLTDRDICMAAYTQGKRLDDIAATTSMSGPVQSCLPSATVEEAEDAMMAHAVHRLVVVDADGHLQGLVSLDDIARSGAAWDGKGEIDLERIALTLGEISRGNSATDEETPESQTPETDLSDLLENSLAALTTLRDEIRVDLNLAGKEVRDRWRRLEARLRAAETRARGSRREGARSLANLVDSAKTFRSRLRDKPASPSPRS